MAVPTFPRDKKARNPNRLARRRADDLRPDLVWRLFEAAYITLKAQVAVEWATGARVSSVLYGVRLCDLILAKGREQITFRGTKNGEDVPAALNPTAVASLKEHLAWRGKPHDREAPLGETCRSPESQSVSLAPAPTGLDQAPRSSAGTAAEA